MSNPVALVTGASRGIGKQLCLNLAVKGYNIVCVARSSLDSPSKLPGNVDDTAQAVRKLGAEAMPVSLDVRDEEGVAKLAQQVTEHFGRCDLLINNAALAPPKPALEDSPARWRAVVDVNLNGPFYLIYHFRNLLKNSVLGGRVVNISSEASVFPEYGRAVYTASKRGLEGMSDALAHDLQGEIAVNVLRIDLPVWSEGFAATLSGENARRFEHPCIISDAVIWLADKPLAHTGEIHRITELRKLGHVRPVTPMANE